MNSIYKMSVDWAKKHSIKVWNQPKTSSTNDVAKHSALDCELFLAGHQFEGRGREENSWSDSNDGGQLLCSWKFKLTHPPQHISAPIIGLCLYSALKKTWPRIQFSIKAPNDIFVGTFKVGGILLESISQGENHTFIVGIGLNISSHPGAIENAGHLAEFESIEVLTKKWDEFLSQLHLNIRNSCDQVIQQSLSLEDQTALLEALNSYPAYAKSILQVLPEGSIVTPTGTMGWQDL